MQEKKPISHLVAGLIIGASLIICSLVTQYLGIESSGIAIIASLVILVGGLIIFISLFGKAKDYQVGFGGLFSYGFKTTAVLILITVAFTVMYLLIFPEYKEQAIEKAREQIAKQKDITPSEVEKNVDAVRRLFWVYTIGYILLSSAIIGAISSLIGAAITKKKKINPVDQLNM